MCNAWHHPAGCDCGFGPQHGYCPVPTSIRADWSTGVAGNWWTECWWCGGKVDFYRAPNGGCALFDELGPPWPLHECWVVRRASSLPSFREIRPSLKFVPRAETDPPPDSLVFVFRSGIPTAVLLRKRPEREGRKRLGVEAVAERSETRLRYFDVIAESYELGTSLPRSLPRWLREEIRAEGLRQWIELNLGIEALAERSEIRVRNFDVIAECHGLGTRLPRSLPRWLREEVRAQGLRQWIEVNRSARNDAEALISTGMTSAELEQERQKHVEEVRRAREASRVPQIPRWMWAEIQRTGTRRWLEGRANRDA